MPAHRRGGESSGYGLASFENHNWSKTRRGLLLRCRGSEPRHRSQSGPSDCRPERAATDTEAIQASKEVTGGVETLTHQSIYAFGSSRVRENRKSDPPGRERSL